MKRLAISSFVIAFLAIANHSSAQVGLGLSSATRVSSAASLSTPSVSNALRASTSATRATAHAATSTAKTTTKATTTSTTQAINSNKQVNADADVKVKTSSH